LFTRFSINDPVYVEQVNDRLPIFTKRRPHGGAPLVDHPVTFGPRRRGEHVVDCDYPAGFGDPEGRPGPLGSPHLHVRQLHLPARKPLLHVQIKAHEREGQLDWLVMLVGRLRGSGVDRVLVDERWIVVSEGVVE